MVRLLHSAGLQNAVAAAAEVTSYSQTRMRFRSRGALTASLRTLSLSYVDMSCCFMMAPAVSAAYFTASAAAAAVSAAPSSSAVPRRCRCRRTHQRVAASLFAALHELHRCSATPIARDDHIATCSIFSRAASRLSRPAVVPADSLSAAVCDSPSSSALSAVVTSGVDTASAAAAATAAAKPPLGAAAVAVSVTQRPARCSCPGPTDAPKSACSRISATSAVDTDAADKGENISLTLQLGRMQMEKMLFFSPLQRLSTAATSFLVRPDQHSPRFSSVLRPLAAYGTPSHSACSTSAAVAAAVASSSPCACRPLAAAFAPAAAAPLVASSASFCAAFCSTPSASSLTAAAPPTTIAAAPAASASASDFSRLGDRFTFSLTRASTAQLPTSLSLSPAAITVIPGIFSSLTPFSFKSAAVAVTTTAARSAAATATCSPPLPGAAAIAASSTVSPPTAAVSAAQTVLPTAASAAGPTTSISPACATGFPVAAAAAVPAAAVPAAAVPAAAAPAAAAVAAAAVARPRQWGLLQSVRCYDSRWLHRLERLREPSTYAPSPEIKETEVISADSIHPLLRPITPCWNSRRCGVLGYKVGMLSLWDGWGERHPITVVQVDRCIVLGQRTLDKDGYEAVVLGIGYRPVHKVSKPLLGHYMHANVEPKQRQAEFRCSSDCLLPVGHELSVRHFTAGQYVFVSGFTKEKGYLGVNKRWGFAGQNRSHGVEAKAHSSPGSIGQSKTINVVWRFKKMAGHTGGDPRVVNCKVFRIETQRNLLFLRGCIPGYCGSVVKISDARGKSHYKYNRNIPLHYPTFVPEANVPYPVTMQCTDTEEDPFLYPEIPIQDKED